MPMTNTRRCILCGVEFAAVKRGGRPPSFCCDEHQEQAKRTTTRYCTRCLEPYERTDPKTRPPFFCSHECKNARVCIVCFDRPVTGKNVYCSTKCQAQQRPDCRQCGKDVPTPKNLERWPKYCSQRCRGKAYESRTGMPDKHSISSEAADYMLKLEKLDKPLNILPRSSFTPPRGVPFQNVTPRLAASKKFYEEDLFKALKSQERKQQIITLANLMIWTGDPTDPQALVPIDQLWPWVYETLMDQFGNDTLFTAWSMGRILRSTMPKARDITRIRREIVRLVNRGSNLIRRKTMSQKDQAWMREHVMGPRCSLVRRQMIYIDLVTTGPDFSRMKELVGPHFDLRPDTAKVMKMWKSKAPAKNWYEDDDQCHFSDQALYGHTDPVDRWLKIHCQGA